MTGLIPRIALLASFLAIELLVASVAFDGAAISTSPGVLTHALSLSGAFAVRFLVCFAAILATFTYLDRAPQVTAFSRSLPLQPLALRPGILHLLAIAGAGWFGQQLYLARGNPATADLFTLTALSFSTLALITAALAVLPGRAWLRLASIPGIIWLYSAAGAGLLIWTTQAVRSLWEPASRTTFLMVRALLAPLVPVSVADLKTLELGTSRFSVIIAPQCSGLEGISLLLLFGSLWLILFRKECRFPQALLLLPIGAVILYLLNAVRLAALILIGHAGAPTIALGGFHSQAGWLAFNLVSLGLCVLARRLPWFTTCQPASGHSATAESPATAVYLLPLLSILAAGMVSHALSGDFEWLYALRLAAPCLIFFIFRREYRQIGWNFRTPGLSISWYGPLAGLLVLLLWLGLDQLMKTGTPVPMPHALATASTPARFLWLTLRTLAAVITVPIAEELAFRGFLLRRLQTREFDTLPPTSFSWSALLISSAIFGALHGDRWLAGTLAGLVYAAIFLRRGQLGDAILAHAITNAALAAAVLVLGAWQYW